MIKFFSKSVNPPATDDQNLTVFIPPRINEEQRLFKVISAALYFPYYFSFNWDSFDECIYDLDWIRQQYVTIIHCDIPLISDDRKSEIYLDIISNMQDMEDCKFQPWFPEEMQGIVENILKKIHNT